VRCLCLPLPRLYYSSCLRSFVRRTFVRCTFVRPSLPPPFCVSVRLSPLLFVCPSDSPPWKAPDIPFYRYKEMPSYTMGV
jgi:hypothetical protein